jgi:hypothetical protein
MRAKRRVSAVSYLNTSPLIWGLMHGPQQGIFDVALSLPSGCADALRSGEADIGSDDLIGIGMAADAVRAASSTRKASSPTSSTATSTTRTSAPSTAASAPSTGPWGIRKATCSGQETIFQKIQETLDLGGTGVLMQGGLHPDLKIEWYEDLLPLDQERFRRIHLHCFSAPEVTNIAEVSGLSLATRSRGCATPGWTRFPAAAPRSWTTKCATASAA